MSLITVSTANMRPLASRIATPKFHSGVSLHRVPLRVSTWRIISCKTQERVQSTTVSSPLSGPHTPYTLPTRGILSKLPPSWVPFAELSRIEKPGGLYGFYMAYLIGLGYGACLAAPTVSPTSLLSTAAVLLVYNVFLRGAACTVNDILDRDFDRRVARCRNRPVARRAVTPAQGYWWYAAQTVGAGAAITCLPSPGLALAYAGRLAKASPMVIVLAPVTLHVSS